MWYDTRTVEETGQPQDGADGQAYAAPCGSGWPPGHAFWQWVCLPMRLWSTAHGIADAPGVTIHDLVCKVIVAKPCRQRNKGLPSLHAMKTSGYAPGSDASPPPRVLVVDDDSAIRTLITTVLVRNGYSVETARNGDEAIQTIVGSEFDAVILDLMMPKVDGFEVIEHMERTSGSELLKRCVIVLTAVSEKDLRKLDVRRVFRVIRKPFDLAELLGAVSECIAGQECATTS